MLTVKSPVTKGTCVWCRATDKWGLDVEFHDGSIKGFLCRAHFWSLLKSRGSAEAAQSDQRHHVESDTV